jgi:hypothetical protein
MLRVYFDDHGQDFLEWDIQDGVVVGCHPFQGWLWNGTKVYNEDIKPGDYLQIESPGVGRTSIKYPVERVEEIAGGARHEICTKSAYKISRE